LVTSGSLGRLLLPDLRGLAQAFADGRIQGIISGLSGE
jgi:hypothetical protein